MKVLFVTGPTTESWYQMVPLCQAVRLAGHQVFVAGHEDVLSAVIASGFPAVAVSSATLPDCLVDRRGEKVELPIDGHDRDLAVGRVIGRFAARSLDGLSAFVEQWRPDRVIGDAWAPAGRLAAHRHGVPHVRFGVDIATPVGYELAAVAELGPELEKLGLFELPPSWLSLSSVPSALRPADAPPSLPVRYFPFETQMALEPWMYTRDERPRVVVSMHDQTVPWALFGPARLKELMPDLPGLDAEIVVAASRATLEQVGPLPDGVRAGHAPLAVLAADCDLVVHQGYPDSVLTCLDKGVPQVFLPAHPGFVGPGEQLAELGAARVTCAAKAVPAVVADLCGEALADPGAAKSARRLRAEAHAMPNPSRLVERITAAADRAEEEVPA
ncbi:nucleotide disphospho-sugar-binding domain-containing protein [Nonomuraea sp. NPDC046802]|uniref:nucleotide disphospho-sugar-binding domain-containing protein n=1 Tax=Nonomuraea sp. NPDC046802 TaxID=3154919 RepID=UPI0033D08210